MLLFKPYIWNQHLHIFNVLWWVVFLCTRQNIVPGCFAPLNSAVALSPRFFCVWMFIMAANVVLAEACDTEGASDALWTQGRHSLPSSAGWGWEGVACLFQSLPAHYAPDSCILIPTPYLTSCMHTLTLTAWAHSHLLPPPSSPSLSLIIWENIYSWPIIITSLGCVAEVVFLSALSVEVLSLQGEPYVPKGRLLLEL